MRITPEIFEIFMGRKMDDKKDDSTFLYCQHPVVGTKHSICGWCVTHSKMMKDCHTNERTGCKAIRATP